MPSAAAVALALFTALPRRYLADDFLGRMKAPETEAPEMETQDVMPEKPSCLDKSEPLIPVPENISQKGNPYNVTVTCVYEVGWEHSEFLSNLMRKEKKVTASLYTFKVCWANGSSNEVRQFPWVITTTHDWRYTLAGQGSVTLHPQNVNTIWRNGFLQVLPDALDYFARMGEVYNRKIIPKFLLYGWSKGATFNLQLGAWRPDVVQGSVLVHGCNWEQTFDNTFQKRSNKKGAAPQLFFSSKNDGFLKCSSTQTRSYYKKMRKVAPLQFHQETPCGHHPDQCHPVCDLKKTFYNPFWDFVKAAYNNDGCSQWSDKRSCKKALCKWDSQLGICGDEHPTHMTPSCEKFCELEQTDDCAQVDISNCSSSYVISPTEEAMAAEMHSLCEHVDGVCQQAADRFQCFFQDQCA